MTDFFLFFFIIIYNIYISFYLFIYFVQQFFCQVLTCAVMYKLMWVII